MVDFILFYCFVGFVLNTALTLRAFYGGADKGYVILPEPFIYFITMFSWPKTLWDIIASFGKDEEDD